MKIYGREYNPEQSEIPEETIASLAFARLVAEMRFAQNRYFKTRDQKVLIECKQLEQKVDKEVRRICGPHN